MMIFNNLNLKVILLGIFLLVIGVIYSNNWLLAAGFILLFGNVVVNSLEKKSKKEL